MKKWITAILLFLVFAIRVFAQTTSNSRDGKAELPVFWDLTDDIESSYSYEFGFYEDSSGTSLAGDKLTLTSNNNTTGVLKGEGSVYIIWEIAAPMPITLTLSGSGAMTGTKEEGGQTSTTINWETSWPSDDSSITPEGAATISAGSVGGTEAGSVSYQPVEILTHNGSVLQYISSGYCKIDIETANAFTADPGEYSATLTLGISND